MFDLIGVPFGYRMIGIWDQFPVYTRDEIVQVIQHHLGFRNIGISCCAFVNGDEILLYLFFDFDANDILVPWHEAKRTYNHFVDGGYTCCLNFSGKKGFHVLVKVVPKNYPSKQVKDVQRHYRNSLLLTTIDEQTFGDKRRLFRIPYTYNIGGTWCRVIAWNEGKELDLDIIAPNDYQVYKKNEKKADDTETRKFYRPCIEYLIHNKDYWIKNHPRHSFEPSEPIRLSWAGIRIWAGRTIDEMVEEAREIGWADWDEDKVRKKLEYLMDRKWTPHSCDSLEQLGYCLDEIDCKKKWDRILAKVGVKNGNGGS